MQRFTELFLQLQFCCNIIIYTRHARKPATKNSCNTQHYADARILCDLKQVEIVSDENENNLIKVAKKKQIKKSNLFGIHK